MKQATEKQVKYMYHLLRKAGVPPTEIDYDGFKEYSIDDAIKFIDKLKANDSFNKSMPVAA